MYHVKKFLNQLLSQNRVLSFCFDIFASKDKNLCSSSAFQGVMQECQQGISLLIFRKAEWSNPFLVPSL